MKTYLSKALIYTGTWIANRGLSITVLGGQVTGLSYQDADVAMRIAVIDQLMAPMFGQGIATNPFLDPHFENTYNFNDLPNVAD